MSCPVFDCQKCTGCGACHYCLSEHCSCPAEQDAPPTPAAPQRPGRAPGSHLVTQLPAQPPRFFRGHLQTKGGSR